MKVRITNERYNGPLEFGLRGPSNRIFSGRIRRYARRSVGWIHSRSSERIYYLN